MLIKIGGKIAKRGGRISKIQDIRDVILTFRVIGSYFPARRTASVESSIQIFSANNVDNIMYIDYKDGTGEHAYPFRASGANRRIILRGVANATTPATIAGSSVYDVTPALFPPYGVHFFQDLPTGVKDTVNDTYNKFRDIDIRFSNPQAIISISFNNINLYGQLPAALSKLENIDTLGINYSRYITLFPQDFYSSRIKRFSAATIGSVFNAGWPQWILNSPLISINVAASMDLSGNPIAKNFDKIHRLKHTLTSLNISETGVNYQLPDELTELYRLTELQINNIMATSLRMPQNLTGLIALATISMFGTRMPFAEVERTIQGLPALKTLNIVSCNYTSDYNMSATNATLESIQIGNQSWNGGAVPSFVNKLIGLKSLLLNSGSATLNTSLNSWGDFRACTELVTIAAPRVTTMPALIPSWMASLVKWKNFNAAAVYITLARVNAFVDSFYTLITTNAPMTGTSANALRSMNVDIYGTQSSETANSVRPSGTYQQPAGYVAGSNNGSPASQMEKIWVLANQYGHIWTVKP